MERNDIRKFNGLKSPLWSGLHSPLFSSFDGSALAGGGGAWSVLDLSPLAWWKPGDFTTAFQDSAGTTPVTAAGQTIGLLTDKSGNSKSAIQATPANEPLLTPGLGIRQADTTDVIVATLTTGGTAYINTPVGWYRSNAPDTTYNLPLCDATETIITPTLTGAQETALASYFGTDEKYMICVSTDTTIANLRIYTGGATTALLFIGANGSTVSKNFSLNSNSTYNVASDGLTAPVAVVWPSSLCGASLEKMALYANALSGSLPDLSQNTSLVYFSAYSNKFTGAIPTLSSSAPIVEYDVWDNQLTGSIPELVSATLKYAYFDRNQLTGNIPSLSSLPALVGFGCGDNQLTGPIPGLSANTALEAIYLSRNAFTGSIPDISANTVLREAYFWDNQLTGSIPDLSANTLLEAYQCDINQLTGSIPDLSANTALYDFECSTNQLTGSIPSLTANTALQYFQCYSNQLTGYTGGGVSITLGDFQAQNNLLTEAAVDAILADFVAAGRTSASGTCGLNLGGTGNATPSATGLTDKATLVSRGWTVTTN